MKDILSENWIVHLDELSSECPSDHVLFLGDIALARGVADKIEEFGYKYNLDAVYPDFQKKDLVVFNLECCLTERGEAWEPKPVLMNGKAEYLNIFPSDTNYSVNVANNHFLDLGELGAQDTLDHIYEQGMDCFGAIDNDLKSFQSTVSLPNTIISMLAYSPAAHPFICKADVNVSYKMLSEMVLDIQLLKNTDELLIVSLHQGVEFCRYTDKKSRERAHALIDAGAESVICHHTHVIQGVEIYRGKAIFYGIGNFLIDIDTKSMPNTKYSLGLEFLLQDNKIKQIKVTPYFINEKLQVEYLTGFDKERLHSEINWLSSFFTNPIFSMINYGLARYMWTKLHLRSLINMWQRTGLRASIKYYNTRVWSKLFNR
ncbi:MAG: hypothetical protein ACJAT7_000698 [Psychromonas sp.]|jgi:hypothetical protein|uniref:CapA family protein n=1 Tax=Psychromonas sp. TaxID=1884585 RepID=UPI0039E477D6